ncbi:MAG: hypothetical protein IGBAC_0989 [Ignavibacteriae bacterium]|nr:MAG: hypothetical protein IGBAC_0989 [Ignavibacteriota bacterium]
MKSKEQFSDFIISNQKEFLKYLKSKFPMFHKSNIFLQDLYYGIYHFLKDKGKKVKFGLCVDIFPMIIQHFEKENVFKKIDNRTWMLNNIEYLTPRVNEKVNLDVKQ